MNEKKGFFAMFKLGVVLAVYAAAACVGLAFVYSCTKDKIEENQKAVMEEALLGLFPEADNFEAVHGVVSPDPAVTIIDSEDNPGTFEVFKNDTCIGLALKTSRGGYGGPITILVGVGTDKKIRGIKILEHSETPGLGANAVKPAFYGQFTGKPVSDAFAVKQDVDAITASTITSVAVSASVKAAGAAALLWFSNSGEAE